MKFLFFLLFLICVGGVVFFLFYKYDKNISTLLRDNRLLKSQLLKLKEKYNTLNLSAKNYSIKFLTVDNRYGILSANSYIYIFPGKDSYPLRKIEENLQVAILEKVLIEESTWYYVALPITSNINSRGWVNESNLSNLSSESIESEKK